MPRAASSVSVTSHGLDSDDEVAEAGAAVDRGFVWIVDEFDGDELVARKFEHGQVPQAGLRDVAHDLVTHGGVERAGGQFTHRSSAQISGPRAGGRGQVLPTKKWASPSARDSDQASRLIRAPT
jgi:hypothetical protein